MIRPDILLSWPCWVDYPVCRATLMQFSDLFNQVIICFTMPAATKDKDIDMDFRKNLRDWGPKALYLDSPDYSGGDWRDVAVNHMLEKSQADWVLFLEQDFTFSPTFINKLLEEREEQVVGFGEAEDSRLHPACLLVSRQAIDKTSKYFGVVPDSSDHFGQFSKELKEQNKWLTLQQLDLWPPDWFHYAGITQNYYLCLKNQYNQLHQTPLFKIYNDLAIKAPVVQFEKFLGLANQISHTLSEQGGEK